MDKLKALAPKLVVLAVLLVVIFLAAPYAKEYLTLEALKQQREEFASFYAANALMVLGVYFGIYVLVTALSLPGALILTLASGALFGVVVGTLVVSFASSIGATLAFLVSRYLLGDFVQRRYADRLAGLNRGVEEEGAFYLFAMRLLPVLPFFLINILMGLTTIKTVTFYWVSQLGMLAGTLVFVNAGTQLANIETPGDILSPGLLASFVALAVIPYVAKKSIAAVRRRRQGAKPTTAPEREDAD